MNWVTSQPAQASASVICTPLAPLPMTPQRPRAEEEVDAGLQSRLHAHSEIRKELL
jgi:hypothetical protein